MEDIPLAGLEIGEDDIPFGLPDFLDDHLLGRLCGDPSQDRRVERKTASDGLDLAGFAVDLDRGRFFLARSLAGGGRESLLDTLEYDFLVDRLVTADGVDQPKEFTVHGRPRRIKKSGFYPLLRVLKGKTF